MPHKVSGVTAVHCDALPVGRCFATHCRPNDDNSVLNFYHLIKLNDFSDEPLCRLKAGLFAFGSQRFGQPVQLRHGRPAKNYLYIQL